MLDYPECSVAAFPSPTYCCLWLWAARLQSPDKRLCSEPCQHPSQGFIFGRSSRQQHSTYPAQSRHRVAWQLLHLPNPEGSQSEPANMQRDGAWTKTKETFNKNLGIFPRRFQSKIWVITSHEIYQFGCLFMNDSNQAIESGHPAAKHD